MTCVNASTTMVIEVASVGVVMIETNRVKINSLMLPDYLLFSHETRSS